MADETLPFDIADEPDDDEALATGDPAYFAHALGKVTKVRGMRRTAREVG